MVETGRGVSNVGRVWRVDVERRWEVSWIHGQRNKIPGIWTTVL